MPRKWYSQYVLPRVKRDWRVLMAVAKLFLLKSLTVSQALSPVEAIDSFAHVAVTLGSACFRWEASLFSAFGWLVSCLCALCALSQKPLCASLVLPFSGLWSLHLLEALWSVMFSSKSLFIQPSLDFLLDARELHLSGTRLLTCTTSLHLYPGHCHLGASTSMQSTGAVSLTLSPGATSPPDPGPSLLPG